MTGAAVIDLTHVYRNGMFGSARLQAPSFTMRRPHGPDGPRITTLEMPVHTGTHVDSPVHFVDGAPSIEELPLSTFSGEAVCWRLDAEPMEEISRRRLEQAHAALPASELVLLSTGWGELFSAPERYARHPYLAVDAAELLVELGVTLIGLDVATPDMPESARSGHFTWPVHRCLLSAGVVIVENLRGLQALEDKRFEFSALPLAIEGADGSPVRAVAFNIREARQA